MGPYLDQTIEAELGLEFHDPDRNALCELDDQIVQATFELGDVEDYPEVPPRGFLCKELNAAQRWSINALLAPQYAEKNVKDQRNLLDIPVEESGHQLVDLPSYFQHDKLAMSYSEQGFHPACGPYANKQRIWKMRTEAANHLRSLIKAFNRIDIQLHLEDAFRPEEVQEGLFFRRVAEMAQTYVNWDAKTIYAVATCLTASKPALAGHQAGAAVDFRLRKISTQKFLPLGNGYSDHGIHGCIHFPYVTWEEYRTRMLFAHISRAARFRFLNTEDWHVSFGDRGMSVDGELKMRKAMYGPVKKYDEHGNVTKYSDNDADRFYLTEDDAEKLVQYARMRDPDNGNQFAITPLEAVDKLRYDKRQTA